MHNDDWGDLISDFFESKTLGEFFFKLILVVIVVLIIVVVIHYF
jgi:hypothetical protein